MIDTAFKELIKSAVREALQEAKQGPLVPIDAVAEMLGCRPRAAKVALAGRGIPIELIGKRYYVNRESLEAIGRMAPVGRSKRAG